LNGFHKCGVRFFGSGAHKKGRFVSCGVIVTISTHRATRKVGKIVFWGVFTPYFRAFGLGCHPGDDGAEAFSTAIAKSFVMYLMWYACAVV
jgi:hypothetical protein